MTTLDAIHECTRGRPYVLVVMAYKDPKTKADKRKKVFELIRDVIEKEFNLACLRADEVLTSGHPLLGKIHLLIDRASLVIAEISEARPNVFYELGYTMGSKRSSLLLIEAGLKPPYDLQGLEVFEYQNTFDGFETFGKKLTEHLRIRLKPELPALRDFLAAPRPEPAYIVASPKYPGENSRIAGQVFDSRTFGDHLGILGLISAFGAIYGDPKGVELISAQHAPPDLLERDINLHLIGSRKVNPWSGLMLDRLQRANLPHWSLDPAPWWQKGEEGDWPVALYRTEDDQRSQVKGKVERLGEPGHEVWTMDHGLLVRGPHPGHSGRLVLIMAGAHSLGTAAACLVATRPALIKKLREKLPPDVLEDKERTIWALVKGTVSRQDFLLDEQGTTVEGAGVYE